MHARKDSASTTNHTFPCDKQSRRRSPLLSLFSSHGQLHRSQSLNVDGEMPQESKKRPSLASLFNKATRSRLLRRSPQTDMRCTSVGSDDSFSPEQREQLEQYTVPADCPAAGPPNYFVAINEEEADRIQKRNDLVKLAFEDEFLIPVDLRQVQDGRVLDIGCGPGSWCIDIAEEYPNVQVIGLDTVNMFPGKHEIPPNCQLVQHNVLGGLGQFPSDYFDYVHIRFMNLAFTQDQYKALIQECWRVLKPGRGYLELVEMDMMVYSPGPVTAKLNKKVLDSARNRGLKPRLARQLGSLMPSDATQQTEKYRSLPIGLWGGRLGVLFRDDLLRMLKQTKLTVDEYFKISSQEDFEKDLEIISRELETYHSYSNFHYMVGLKPSHVSEPQAHSPRT